MMAPKKILLDIYLMCVVWSAWKDVETGPVTNCEYSTCWIALARYHKVCDVLQGKTSMQSIEYDM